MRIGLGAEALSPQLTGIGRYTWELASRLSTVTGVESLKLFRDNAWFANCDHFLKSSARRPQRLPRKINKWLTKREFERRIFHGPNFFFPPQAANAVVTVHDLSVFRFPEMHPIERIKHFEKEFDRSITDAQHIITDTNYIKDELTDLFGVPAARITSVPLGVSEDFFEVGDKLADERFLAQHQLHSGRYCLCVATIEPRKGLDHAVKSFLSYKEKVRDNTQLVIVGASGWHNSSLHTMFESAAATGHVKFLGFIPDPALRVLYRHCALFVYPSLYEGFGLPVLEAMASGAPTLISNRSCLPEVSGDVGIAVDVEDHDAFREAIAQALQDESWRRQTINSGLALARRHNWQRCAEETVAVYGTLTT